MGRIDGTASAGPGARGASAALLALLLASLACAAQAAVASAKKPPHRHRDKRPPGKVVHCKAGQALVRVGKRSFCANVSLAVSRAATPQEVAVHNALSLDLGLRDKRGRRSPSLARLFERAGPKALKNTQAAIARGIAKGEALASPAPTRAHAAASGRPVASAASAGCGSSREAQAQKEFEEAPQSIKEGAQHEKEAAEQSKSFSDGDVQAKVDFEKGAIELGIDVKGKGIHIAIDLDLCSERNSFKLDSCPTAQGVVEGHDEHALQFGMRVTRGKELLLAQSFKLSGETTIKAQTGDDGKLDYFDIKHVDKSLITLGGSKRAFGPLSLDVAYIGEARVDMRSGGGTPAKPDVAVTMSAAGVDPHERIAAEIDVARKLQKQADENFAAEIKKVSDGLRGKEAHWLEPNKCASIHFEPASETLTLQKGASGTFTSRADAAGGGSPATAKWTASAQQNATFAPGGGEANPLSSNYDVTNAGKGILVSETLKATSKAGVAEATWKQKTAKAINTLTGTFTGHWQRQSPEGTEVLDWSGTATLRRVDATGQEIAGVFSVLFGEATVTASGIAIGSGCEQRGSQSIPLSPASVWSVENQAEPFSYQIEVPFGPDPVTVTWVNCAEPANDGFTTSTGSVPASAIQSGPVFGGTLSQSSADGIAYEGSASAAGVANGLDAEESESWSWSFKGSP